jgi:hypothetical protein
MKPKDIATREPVNKQARQFFSKGTDVPATVEQALEIIGATICGEVLQPWVRKTLDRGLEAEMKVTIRHCRTGPGFNVILSTQTKAAAKNPAHFTSLT